MAISSSLAGAAVTAEAAKAGYRMKLSSRSAWPSDGIDAVRDVAVFGSRAYLLGDQEIAILDVADPAIPRKIGGVRLGLQTLLAFAADGTHLFGLTVRNNSTPAELLVWDVRDPLHPIETASFQLSAPPHLYQGHARMRRVGTQLFLAQFEYDENGAGIGRLDIFDVSNPREMTFLATYHPSSGGIEQFTIAGNRLYSTAGRALEVIDISTPSSPKLLGSGSFPAQIGGLGAIEVRGSHAYISGWDGTNYMGVFDISDPRRPVPVARWDARSLEKYKITDRYLYAMEWDRMVIFDLSNPTNPPAAGSIGGYFGGIDAIGNHIYLADRQFGLRIFDVSNLPSAPTPIGHWRPPVLPANKLAYWQIAVSGNYAYVTTRRFTDEGTESSLLVFDARDSDHPDRVAQMPLSEGFDHWRSLDVHGNLLHNGATLIDVSNPIAPKIIGNHEAAEGFAMAGGLVYSAAETLFQITDVSDPAEPRPMGRLELPPPADHNIGRRGVKLSGNYAFVTGDSDLHILDIGNPAAPRLIATYSPAGASLLPDLAISGSHLYVASVSNEPDPVTGHNQPSISVFDITDPEKPARIATHPFPHTGITSMKVSGRHLYIRRHESHMPGEYNFHHVFDIQDPKAIFEVAQFGDYKSIISPYPNDMVIHGNNIFTVGSSFQIFSADYIPFLGIRLAGDQVEFNWPNVDQRFQLQQKTALNPAGVWTNAQSAPALQDGQFQSTFRVTIDLDGESRFFRLARP